MGLGLHTALQELSLILFTPLTPAGAFACMLIALLQMESAPTDAQRTRLRHMMGLPLVVSTVGIIASSTHLGTPANALYVITGIGRSPLSNEVACVLVFLIATGAFWLYSFSIKPNAILMKALGTAVAVLGLVCVAGISFAYDQETIVTWVTWMTPAGTFFGGLACGIPLFLLTVHLAQAFDAIEHMKKPLLGIGIAAFAANTACAIAQYAAVSGMSNEFLSVSELAPGYPAYIAAYVLCTACARYLCGMTLLTKGAVDEAAARTRGRRLLFATILAALGFFSLRFVFYMVHMTVGFSL